MGASLAAAVHNYYKTLNKGGLAMPTTEGEQVDNAVQREELERSLHKIVNAHGTRSFHYRQSTPMMNELVKFVEAYAATQADKARLDEVKRIRKNQSNYIKAITGHVRNTNAWPSNRGTGAANKAFLDWLDNRIAQLTPQSDTKGEQK